MKSRQAILIALSILLLSSLLLFIVFGDNGLIDLNRLKTERDDLLQKNESLKQENLSLYREIERLKNDPEYVENVARQELGVVGKDEVILKPPNNRKPQID
ncbi:MAG: septum formation initiator family protein [Desulfobacterales bacterium]|nr:MAG: septum formation initiator family protein [Desulfobacterales bacterium]UCD89841.1 MAG: septum formation initiator family protein [Desulfobacterales bacterium]